jgi:hypothetical protein
MSSKLLCRDVVTEADHINLSRDHDVRVHADPRVHFARDCPYYSEGQNCSSV